MLERRQFYTDCIIAFYNRSLGQLVNTQPTIGSNVEEIKYNNVQFQAWDLGGQESMRSVWDAYYVNTDVRNFSIRE